jgi:AcrR family transcriptional regulator
VPKVPKQSRRKPASSRPGPKPLVPTKRQRHAVEVAVATGMTVDQIAAAIEMSRKSVYVHFTDELAAGRAKRLLANALRLDQAANEGSVPAMKYLHTLMLERGQELEPDDQWADVAESISTQNPESRDLH